MAQVASAFPTAGGLYHWAAILGGRGWGWAVAWLNLAGLVAALAAINVGGFAFARAWLATLGDDRLAVPSSPLGQAVGVALIVGSQAVLNHRGVRLVARLLDLAGYLILLVALGLTVALLSFAPALDPARLVTFANHSPAPSVAGSGPSRRVWSGCSRSACSCRSTR